jgi:hypothetical protein
VAKIEQGVADRGQFPVDNRGQTWAVARNHHVREVEVTMDEPTRSRLWAMAVELRCESVDLAETSDAPALDHVVRTQLTGPPPDLPF